MNVKICGLTRPEDVRLAVELGATHVGCVLEVADSPRSVAVADAVMLMAAAGGAEPVLVFRRPMLESVRAAVRTLGVSVVQLHLADPEVVRALRADGLEVWTAVDMTARTDVPSTGAPGHVLVLDVGGGGSGQTFDWARLTPRAPDYAFLAGGITPDNVAGLAPYRPYGIDVSSGVEAQPGHKDPRLLRALFANIQQSFSVSGSPAPTNQSRP